MIVKDKLGDKIEILITGSSCDEIEIYEARYICDSDRDVEDETLHWVEETYQSQIYQEWLVSQVDMAIAYEER